MPYDPHERRRVGQTNLTVTRLGFGAAEIGGLYKAVTPADAESTIRHAWDIGIRYFDVAPLYGFGMSESRLGRVLREVPREAFVISSKVGRLLRIPSSEAGGSTDRYVDTFVDAPPLRPIFDFSRDGILRSIEETLERLGLARLDIVYLHDPDDHWQEAIDSAYPALERLRGEGVVGAIGAGMNQSAMLARFAREGDFDIFMCAGRYTLLDQSALDDLLPICVDKGIAVAIASVMNSGILADPGPTARFDYAPAALEWSERAARLQAVCDRHGVPLRAAAIQFPLAHPATATLVTGVRSRAHLDEYPLFMRSPIPGELWIELQEEGLIRADAPVPS